jgi:uncharacterized protein YfiM (DUF2279 family)
VQTDSNTSKSAHSVSESSTCAAAGTQAAPRKQVSLAQSARISDDISLAQAASMGASKAAASIRSRYAGHSQGLLGCCSVAQLLCTFIMLLGFFHD